MNRLVLVRPDEIDCIASRLLPYLTDVCARSKGRYLPQHMLDWARSGEWQIWLIVEEGKGLVFVGGTEILTFPTGKKALAIRFGTGKGRELWQHHIDDVLNWAKAQGCTLAEGIFRKGWARVLPGWDFTHAFLERPL